MGQVPEALIAVKHERGGQPYFVKENPSTLGERIAYARSIVLGKTQLQLAEDAGLCERTVIRLETGEVTQPLLVNILAIAEVLGVSIDWLCGRIEESGDDVGDEGSGR